MFPAYKQPIFCGLRCEGRRLPFMALRELTILTTRSRVMGCFTRLPVSRRLHDPLSLRTAAPRGVAISMHDEDRGMSGVAAMNHEGALATQGPRTEGAVS
jgi:hypothetical protein